MGEVHTEKEREPWEELSSVQAHKALDDIDATGWCADALFLALACHDDQAIRGPYAAEVDAPLQYQAVQAQDDDLFIRKQLASNSHTDPGILAMLGTGSTDNMIRVAVAKNPSTPDSVLDFIAAHPEANSKVRELVARHHNASRRCLDLLRRDPNLFVVLEAEDALERRIF